MRRDSDPRPALPHPPVLGIEAGGTRTTACWLPGDTAAPRLAAFEGANLQLVSDPQLLSLFRRIAESFPAPAALGIAMAGARTEADRHRIRRTAGAVWPQTPVVATHDLDAALAAASPPDGTAPRTHRILILSGTGSCCYGVAPGIAGLKVGGWGHLLGDQGSGYDIALRTLRAVIERWDQTGTWPALGRRLLGQLGLGSPDALIPWMAQASKAEVAALTPLVFHAAKRGERLCRSTLDSAAASLAEAALACARRLRVPASGANCDVVLAGSVILEQAEFAARIARPFKRRFPRARITSLSRPGAEGAARLALVGLESPRATRRSRPKRSPSRAVLQAPRIIPTATHPSPTEARHPDSTELDRMPLSAAVRLMIEEDRRLPEALLAVAPQIERAVRCIAASLARGGRLFYVGAGTSGRLGVLDASECPPTFRTPPDLIQAIIAGGEGAVFRAVEGAEDDYPAGRHALALRGVHRRDTVVGIAASGRTPFVWGALEEARRVRASTVLVTLQPHLKFPRGSRPKVVIAPSIGPELLTGSTRLKSGTVTKQILNLFTTLAMVRLGKVIGNLMIDLNPSNLKLRDRAVRIVCELTGAPAAEAARTLEHHGWIVRKAVTVLKRR